jgi:hypothetical protein
VKSYESKCDWYNSNQHKVSKDIFFRANQGSNTYGLFDELPSGEGVLSLTTSSNPIELSRSDWGSSDLRICTVISFGIQVSDINSENAKILDIYTTTSGTKPETLRTTRLFTGVDDEVNKIAIPTEVLNKNDNSKYHLVQIIRHFSGTDELNSSVYEDSLYIDGMLESVNRNTSSSSMVVKMQKR